MSVMVRLELDYKEMLAAAPSGDRSAALAQHGIGDVR
jgi:hypothetical protein